MIQQFIRAFVRRCVTLLASRLFLRIILVFFVLEALWFVFSAAYPMAFDEDFHFGLIRLYSEHWSPFISSHVTGADSYGAVARDPSYLYHYIMSFPYRLIVVFTDNQTIQVILLRLINVALFTTGILLFRRVLQRMKLSAAFTNTSLALFALIPIVPMLAAHINYDNLLMPLTAWMLLLTFTVAEGLRKRTVLLKPLTTLVVMALLTTLVKYPALPIIVALGMCLAVITIVSFWRRASELWPATRAGVRALSRPAIVALSIALVLAGLLFGQRYGVNLIKYHTSIPHCDVALSVEKCSAYGPWLRNYTYRQILVEHPELKADRNPLNYSSTWFSGLHHRLFFAVNGPVQQYATRLQLPVPGAVSWLLSGASVVVLIVFGRRALSKNMYLGIVLAVALVYCLALFTDGYEQYIETGQPVAINGRYLLPVLLPIAGVVGAAWAVALRKRPRVKLLVTGLVLAGFLYGGGVMTFILRSDKTWDWPNSTVVQVNDMARRVLGPFIYEGKVNVN